MKSVRLFLYLFALLLVCVSGVTKTNLMGRLGKSQQRTLLICFNYYFNNINNNAGEMVDMVFCGYNTYVVNCNDVTISRHILSIKI